MSTDVKAVGSSESERSHTGDTTFLLHKNKGVVSWTTTSKQFKRWLSQQGCSFERGKGGHLIVRRGGFWSVIPMHGSRKELGIGLVSKIKKDLGLK